MTEVKNDIREMAVRYFEGRISRADEELLYHFIHENKNNYSLFKEWEKQWLKTSVTDERTEREWEKLQVRMQTRKAVIPMLPSSVFAFWRKIAAVVALVVLTAGATLGIEYLATGLQPETFSMVEAPYGERSKITLADGTRVWLNSGSRLQYSDRFDKNNRVVKLEGEGYFEVNRQDGKQFTVETSAYSVVVKGTKFNISAYSDDSYVATTLIEGKVELLYGRQIYEMSPGEAMKLNLASGTFLRQKVNARQAKAWLDNKVEFDHITLKELATRLSRQYNVRIEIESETLGNKAFRISLRNRETISEVMEALQELMSVTIEYKGKYIYIKE